ncbi:hypothetical protein H5203_20315 [Pseudoalteromonas sp. SG41-1]|uniref:hypothetical protein n=1 Tax=Pseudoalteromonas sp. SG41-1 TaxID=2760979 RepID=UPI0016008F26|nr:hypothetical protein [Pseudoalteromonas sp. SG41-1]MBB1507798.1 hypothetical protein [Pseudoalteromonas sp. SG41-1]
MSKEVIKVRMWPLDLGSKSNSFISLILVKKIIYSPHNLVNFFNFNFNIFHMHWPETYLNIKNPLKRYTFTLLIIIYISFIKILGKKVVWTVHNLKPHENYNERISRIFYKVIASLCDSLIFMTNVSMEEFFCLYGINKKFKIIPHPSYPIPKANTSNVQKPSGLLFFGLIRPYKNVEMLINAYINSKLNIKLNILGACNDILLTKKLESYEDRINLSLRRYEDQELQCFLDNCSGVVIPYKDITNSGVLFRAMSAGAKLLLPDIAYTREVTTNLNYQNCSFYSGDIDSMDLLRFCEEKEREVSISFSDINHSIKSDYLAIYKSLKS